MIFSFGWSIHTWSGTFIVLVLAELIAQYIITKDRGIPKAVFCERCREGFLAQLARNEGSEIGPILGFSVANEIIQEDWINLMRGIPRP